MNKQGIIKDLKNNEFDIQSAKGCLLACDLCFGAYVNSELIKNTRINPVYSYVNNNDDKFLFHQIVSEKIFHNYMEKIFSEYLKNPNWLIEKMIEQDKLAVDFDKLWVKYKENKTKLNNCELLSWYDKLIDIFRKNILYWTFGEDKGVVVSKKIINFLVNNHNLSESEAHNIIGKLTHPDFLSTLNKERISYLTLCLNVAKYKTKGNGKILENKKLQNLVDNYIKNYFWIKTDYYEVRDITYNSLMKEIENEIKKKKINGIRMELNSVKKTILTIGKDKRKILSKLKLTKEEKKILSFVSYLVMRQDTRKVCIMKQFFYIFSFLKDVGQKINLNYEYLVAHSVEDVRKIIKKERKIKTKFGQYFIIFERGKKNKIFYDREARKLFALINVYKNDSKRISGIVASQGKTKTIRGNVRIITNPNSQKFVKGEILVTSMTRTDFLPLMRRAKAIITDEGGIACHAAIVSRELGIPCIIGTKIATKVLKDGDLVEVDADKGIVKIIE
jgi:phosphohistidine swiveling domain-containing protein